MQVFGPGLKLVKSRTIDDLFDAILTGKSERAVVPVENTLAGSVQGNLDRILQHSLHVVGETGVRIRLAFVAPPGVPLSEIRKAASHPVALQQCQGFFRDHPDIEPVAVYDTAGSVRDLMDGDCGYQAAIGSTLAAELYGAEVVFPEIEDNTRNFTRFFVVSEKAEEAPREGVKTSLAFVTPHEPGSLHRALGIFADRGVDLTKLESRPIPGRPWVYRFYADVRGDPRGPLKECLKDLRGLAAEFQILGSYAEWDEAE